MSLVFGGTTVNNIVFNGTTIDRIVFNGVDVYTSKPATFMYWNGEYGQYYYKYSDKNYGYHNFRGYSSHFGYESYSTGYLGSQPRVAYINSDGIYFQDSTKSSDRGYCAGIYITTQSGDYYSNAPIIMKDVYVAIDNFVGNPVGVVIHFYLSSAGAGYPIKQYFTVSGNTVLRFHVDYAEKNNFGIFYFLDNGSDTSGTSYVIRRIWYDTY